MTPQLTLTLDSLGNLHAEAPGRGAATRRKIDLAAGDTIYEALRASVFAIAEELLAQRHEESKRFEAAVARQRELERQRHTQIIEYTAAHYPSALKHIDPRVLHTTPAMRKKLRADGYTDSEITLMASRGELVGTSFFTMPRGPRSGPETPKLIAKQGTRSTEQAQLDLAIAQIEL